MKMHDSINITVNGFPETVPSEITIDGLIRHFKEGDADLIVEQNGVFIYPEAYRTTKVCQGDRIEFINPNFGG